MRGKYKDFIKKSRRNAILANRISHDLFIIEMIAKIKDSIAAKVRICCNVFQLLSNFCLIEWRASVEAVDMSNRSKRLFKGTLPNMVTPKTPTAYTTEAAIKK